MEYHPLAAISDQVFFEVSLIIVALLISITLVITADSSLFVSDFDGLKALIKTELAIISSSLSFLHHTHNTWQLIELL